MSVLVKGMKMPKRCWDCNFCKYLKEEWVNFTDANGLFYCKDYFCCDLIKNSQFLDSEALHGKHSDCPIVEVPTPHGDLISREWLIDIALHLLNTAKNDDIANGVKWLWQYIIDAPAIIPAELPKEEKEDKELLVEKIRKLQTYKLAPELEKLVSLEKVIAILEGEE